MNVTSHSINQLLQIEDIEGLLASGAPMDEYFSEAEQIADALAQLSPMEYTRENILAIISLAWMQSFELSAEEMAMRSAAIHRVAAQIKP